MIIPYLFGLGNIRRAPMTWLLCIFNVSLFLLVFQNQATNQEKLSKFLDDDQFMSTQAQVFANFILDHSDSYSEVMLNLARGTISGSTKKTKYLGHLSMRDSIFLNAKDHRPGGDEVAFRNWKKQSRTMASIKAGSFTTQWGLSRLTDHTLNYLSYQFLHGDWFHLLANMFFLLIFGVALEPLIGALGILGTYLIGGAGAAIIFSMATGLSALPLIGASGSVSALMGVFAAFYRTRPVQFFYWILPTKDYVGFIYLPAWVAVLMWVVMDLAGWVGTLPELGGTAHAAHLGGTVFGFICGWLAYTCSRIQPDYSSVGSRRDFPNLFRRY